jgi:hypothetical protein
MNNWPVDGLRNEEGVGPVDASPMCTVTRSKSSFHGGDK